MADTSALLSAVASGQLPSLRAPDDDDLLNPFLPLLSRLQHSRRSHSRPDASSIDRALLRTPMAPRWREYARVFEQLTLSELQNYTAPTDTTPAFRRFESGSPADRARIVLCEWLLAPSAALQHSELLADELYADEVAAILVHTLASSLRNLLPEDMKTLLSVDAVSRKCLQVPLGAVFLSRIVVNDPSSVESVMDAVVQVTLESSQVSGQVKPIAQQEQEALTTVTRMQQNARQVCEELAQLAPLYAAKLRDKLSEQTASLHCAATAFSLMTKCTEQQDVAVFLYQWMKRDGAPGSALRTYVQLATREAAVPPSDFQRRASESLATIQKLLLDTLDQGSLASPYEVTAALGVCVGLQVLGSFPLTDADRMRLLRSLDALATSSSSRAVSLAFIVVVLVWYPLVPALSKAPGQRDEHTKSAVALSQQVLVALFHARDAGAGPLFVVSAVLFYTKAPALVPFLASVIGLDGDTCNTAATSAAGYGINVQQALRAEYLHVFGDVVLKPVLTENLLAREVLSFPPAARVSALDAVSSGHGQHEFTLRGLHGLLCEKSFLRHHHAHRLESWLAAQVGEQAALPVHPLLVSLLLEWIENYVMAFEYPVAQAPRRLQLSIIPLRSATLSKWLGASCLVREYSPDAGRDHELAWARGVLGLTYALQFNQRLRHATMVAGSKLSSLVSTSSVVSGASVAAALGPGADICLHYDLGAFPLRNIVTQALAHGDQGGAFEYVAPTLMKLMMEEHPQLFDAAPASLLSGTTLKLLPLASSPQDEAEGDSTKSWFGRRRKLGQLPIVHVEQTPVSWTAAQLLLKDLEAAPIDVVMRELPVLVDGFVPYAVLQSHHSSTSQRKISAFCAQLGRVYETRARREQGASTALLMRLVHALCFPDALWRQQQLQTSQGAMQLLTYLQVLEEPFRLVEDVHDGVFRQPALLRLLLGLVRDVRAAASVHVTKCDPSLVPVEGMAGIAGSATASVQKHQLLQDCLLVHALLKRLQSLSSVESEEVKEESRAMLCGLLNELLAEDATSPPPLLLAIHSQGYDASLVPILVAHVPVLRLLWDYWMAAATSSTSARSGATSTKPLMEFVAEGAEKDLPKWRFRLRVVLALCAKYLSGRQSAAMQQALRVVWNKLRNGVGSSGDNSTGYVTLLTEVLPWIVDACAQNADLSAELVHFLLKVQKLQQGGSTGGKTREGSRRAVAQATGKPQEQRLLLEQVLRDTYASLLEQV